MDLRAYYKQIREIESTIDAPFVVVISLGTSDGGKGGHPAEVTRAVAARLIADGRSRLASAEEAKDFYDAHAEARREAEAIAAAQRMQVMLVPSSEVKASKGKLTKE